MAKEPKLSDDRIVAIIDYGIGQSVGFSESKLSKERERVQFYFDGEFPRRTSAGDSSYNSRDVFDGVMDMHAQLLETFSANKRPVSFDMALGEDPDASRIRTDYVTDVIFNQNPGYHIFSDTILLGLLGRNGVVKVWWEEKFADEYVHLSSPVFEEVHAYLAKHADQDPQVTEMELHEDGETIKRVTVKLKVDKSQIRIHPLAGEEFGISPMAESMEMADLKFHRHEMTVDELIKAGYDKDIVKDLQSNDRLWMAMEPEKIARFEPTDDLIGTKTMEDGQDSQRVCMVYECYLHLDLDEDGESQLFKVTKVGNTILDKEPVERCPFIDFCPLPRPKAYWGMNFSELLIETQKARTYLSRAIIRHALITNNPRLMVVKNSVMNPKELTENRFGGIVNVVRPDGIVPLPQANLNPFVFQTIELLKSDKEEKTGISALSQGLDKDAISKQNSGEMVHELITVSQLRQKIIARNFAENFLRPLYLACYRLTLENENRQKIARIAGAYKPIDFSMWPEETSVTVSFSLGYGEQAQQAALLAQAGERLAAAPALAPFFGPPQQYNIAHDALVAMGIEGIEKYLAPFQQGQQPPQNPMMAAEVAMKQADAKVKQAQAEAAVQNVQLEAQKQQLQHSVEMAKLQLEMQRLQGELQLKQAELQHKIVVDAAEIRLQDEANAIDKLTASAQPTR